jgi:hypothetical protein
MVISHVDLRGSNEKFNSIVLALGFSKPAVAGIERAQNVRA